MKTTHHHREERRTIKRLYRETPVESGIFAIRNIVNGRVFLGSSLNLHGPLNRHRFTLERGSHDIPDLQADWNTMGSASFVFEILEVVKLRDDGTLDREEELRRLEQEWIAKLQPFGPKGYNRSQRIRHA